MTDTGASCHGVFSLFHPEDGEGNITLPCRAHFFAGAVDVLDSGIFLADASRRQEKKRNQGEGTNWAPTKDVYCPVTPRPAKKESYHHPPPLSDVRRAKPAPWDIRAQKNLRYLIGRSRKKLSCAGKVRIRARLARPFLGRGQAGPRPPLIFTDRVELLSSTSPGKFHSWLPERFLPKGE